MAAAANNGSLQKYLTYAGTSLAVLSFLFTVLWKLFTITAFVEAQSGINASMERRLGVVEKDVGSVQGDTKSLIGDVRVMGARLGETDRRMQGLEDKLSELQLVSVKIARDLNEVETQFCASDNVRNMQHANDQRVVAVIFEKVFAQPFPVANAFFPKVCNRTQSAN